MTKQKVFKDKARIQSNSGKLTNWLTTGTSDEPVVINEIADDPIVINEARTSTTEDDKKKLGLNTSYEGFSIYGRILCLVVKRRGVRNVTGSVPASSQAMLENWVSTQAAGQTADDDEDNS